MYIYSYNNITTCPNLEAIHTDVLTAFPNKEFIGCLYDQCPYACVSCIHINNDDNYFNSLDIEFNIELSSFEKTTLDGIIENNL